MAKYTVTYKCGHARTEQLFGKNDQRYFYIDKAKTKLCPDCYKLEQEKARAAASQAAAEQATKQGLPDLVGSPKQIAWAETIRQEALSSPQNTIKTDAGAKALDEYYIVAEARKKLETESSAKWWIDNRGRITKYVCDCWTNAHLIDKK